MTHRHINNHQCFYNPGEDGKPMKKEFSEADHAEIQRLRDLGVTPRQLAERYHTQTFRIHKVLLANKHNARMERDRVRAEERRRRIAESKNGGNVSSDDKPPGDCKSLDDKTPGDVKSLGDTPIKK